MRWVFFLKFHLHCYNKDIEWLTQKKIQKWLYLEDDILVTVHSYYSTKSLQCTVFDFNKTPPTKLHKNRTGKTTDISNSTIRFSRRLLHLTPNSKPSLIRTEIHSEDVLCLSPSLPHSCSSVLQLSGTSFPTAVPFRNALKNPSKTNTPILQKEVLTRVCCSALIRRIGSSDKYLWSLKAHCNKTWLEPQTKKLPSRNSQRLFCFRSRTPGTWW